MKIQILGTGCPKCNKLAELSTRAADELGLHATIIKVSDINEILSFGVMSTPALAIDGKVLVVGKVPTYPDLVRLLQQGQDPAAR